MNSTDDWEISSAKIPMPTPESPYPQDAYVMGDYFPRSDYEATRSSNRTDAPRLPGLRVFGSPGRPLSAAP